MRRYLHMISSLYAGYNQKLSTKNQKYQNKAQKHLIFYIKIVYTRDKIKRRIAYATNILRTS